MRLIDVAAIDWHKNLFMKGINHNGVWVKYGDVAKIIQNAPIVDAVPVVRCKDCRWRPSNSGEDVCPFSWGDPTYPWNIDDPNPNGYCHLGEREEGADVRAERRTYEESDSMPL